MVCCDDFRSWSFFCECSVLHLQDVLENADVTIDHLFIASLVVDIIKVTKLGITFFHRACFIKCTYNLMIRVLANGQ